MELGVLARVCSSTASSSSSSSVVVVVPRRRPSSSCASHALRVGRRRVGVVSRFKVRGASDEPSGPAGRVRFGDGEDDDGVVPGWSWRMEALATCVTRGYEDDDDDDCSPVVVADVCCGHALLGVGLVMSTKKSSVEKVIGVDRSELELVVARQNVERCVGGESEAVTLMLGDGFAPVDAERVDVAVVAGVGANTMIRILTDGGLARDGRRTDVRRLVLNPPAKDAAAIRRWCASNGWTICDEKLVVENQTMHLVLSLERGEAHALGLRDEIIGPIIGEQIGSSLTTLYVKKRLEWVREVRRQSAQNLSRLRRGDANAEAEKLTNLESEIARFDEMEAVLLEAIGLDLEEQKRRVEEQMKEQIARGFEGFVAPGEELKPGELKFKTVDPGESDGRLGYCREFLSESEANELLTRLIASPPVDWAQRSIVVWQPEENTTKEVVQPRLVSWAGDIPYKYSGQTLEPVAVPDVLRELMDRVSQATGAEYNHVLLNRYRDGYDSMAYHADDEPELGRNANIAAISLGHTRRFDVQLKSKTKAKTSIFLENGSLMVMDGALQHTHYHGVPKNHTPVKGERINITFRLLRGPPGWREESSQD